MDVVFALAGLVILAPLLAVIALVSRMKLGRPILFWQERPGLGGSPFFLVKFRTMRAPTEGEDWIRSDSERLTRWGRFLRAYSLDELPELWNVLRGEMSLVGPRPLLMEYLGRYTERQSQRHRMPPGITGWAQVNGRQKLKFSQRLEMDSWYVENWSLCLDVSILFRTFTSMLDTDDVISGQSIDDVDDLGLNAPQRGRPGDGTKR